jgi:hypothetical protein
VGRIRTIKPEFPQSETIGRVSRDARLLFILLWGVVDDDGRTRGAARMLASLLFPYDDDAPGLVGSWLGELESVGCIRRYTVAGSSYIDIPQWRKHQKIAHPAASRLPAYEGKSEISREDSHTPPEASHAPHESSRVLTSPHESSRVLTPDLGPSTIAITKDQEDSSLRSLSARELEKLADEFCDVFPKRTDRDPAKAKFKKRVKAGVDPHHMIAAAFRLAESHRVAGTDKQYIPSPLVWLNKGRYDDADLPSARRASIHYL